MPTYLPQKMEGLVSPEHLVRRRGSNTVPLDFDSEVLTTALSRLLVTSKASSAEPCSFMMHPNSTFMICSMSIVEGQWIIRSVKLEC